jgi:hypothetical protein
MLRGLFKKFCTLYVFSLKMNLFYKIHLHFFNVISIVLYHSGPTFGQVLYSCLDAFVVDASDYSAHLIRHLLNASEAFPTEWFLQFHFISFQAFQCFRGIEEFSNEVPWVQTHQQRRRPDRNTRFAQTLDRCDKAQWRLHWRPVNVFCKINSFLSRKYTVCRTFEMTHVFPPTYTCVINHTFTSSHSTLVYTFRLSLPIFRNS